MKQEKENKSTTKLEPEIQVQGRRNLLKALGASGSVLATGGLMNSKWSKPVVDSVLLPVHAQTSCVPSALACSVVSYGATTYTDAGNVNIIYGDFGGMSPTEDDTIPFTDAIANLGCPGIDVNVDITFTDDMMGSPVSDVYNFMGVTDGSGIYQTGPVDISGGTNLQMIMSMNTGTAVFSGNGETCTVEFEFTAMVP